ncbi:hypothetical protein BS47DRAFT_141502 [Hydnum rufescens UP504]|uniref:Uncharacterized protein n=1 Tax=Hydnum rufescens UP504 TaxID=1448309 RepID=A0A9P6DSL6_9AGAM|nr:hypothetical protein BS47DRAFT_141502 [Hydnum rufescens UP504]
MQPVCSDPLGFNVSLLPDVPLGDFAHIGGLPTSPTPSSIISQSLPWWHICLRMYVHTSYYSVYGPWLIHIFLIFTIQLVSS